MCTHRIAKGLSQRGHEIIVHTAFHLKALSAERTDGIKVERNYELNPRIARFVNAPVTVMPNLSKLFGKKKYWKLMLFIHSD